MTDFDYDFLVVGSGFGGSVSALRLTEKGYKVLVVEKGREFKGKDFPKTNWNLPKWLWMPRLGFRGPFKMTMFRHLSIFSGVGVGGGSLVYANTLPIPKSQFFKASSWSHLNNNWEESLKPHYSMARKMLGAVQNKYFNKTDEIMKEIATDIGKEEHFEPTYVSVFQGEAGKTVPDPYFDGEGPDRTGCIQCGACMIGCPHNAKNTLDKNYLYLARSKGLTIQAETEVINFSSLPGGGFSVSTRSSKKWRKNKVSVIRARKVVLAGGVLGTVPLLLRMKAQNYLPNLSARLGNFVRTNNESILGVISEERGADFSKGIAISSIINTDEHSHIEPVRYNEGSSFFRLLLAPHGPGRNFASRFQAATRRFLLHPKRWLKVAFGPEFSKRVQILLYMRSLEGTMTFQWGRGLLTAGTPGMVSKLDANTQKPTSFMPQATDLAERFAKKTDGIIGNLFTETAFNIPTTAHILGGCCMGEDKDDGVINHKHQVFGYEDLYVVDGSSVSANPGVNPSLTITALAERAMSFVPPKSGATT